MGDSPIAAAGETGAATTASAPALSVERGSGADATVVVHLAGRWSLRSPVPRLDSVLDQLRGDSIARRIAFDTAALEQWDSTALSAVARAVHVARERGWEVDDSGLPEGLRKLLRLALAVPKRTGRDVSARASFLARIGAATVNSLEASRSLVTFLGEVVLSLGRLVTGRAGYRRVDLIDALQRCGAGALGIVSLISVLVGLILAFVGAIQLQKFGAEIFVADLVGIAMAREMAAMMTAIIMAGRTGAAYAAQLGAMTVNEEIDALQTMAISPIDFLVMPRMVALALMMPLLCVYSSVVGIIGGAIVSVSMLDLSVTQYIHQTQQAVDLTHFAVGLSKSVVFGVLVALAGCYRGMQCGRSASAVGDATTSAVVTAIVWIIVADAVFAVLTNALGV